MMIVVAVQQVAWCCRGLQSCFPLDAAEQNFNFIHRCSRRNLLGHCRLLEVLQIPQHIMPRVHHLRCTLSRVLRTVPGPKVIKSGVPPATVLFLSCPIPPNCLYYCTVKKANQRKSEDGVREVLLKLMFVKGLFNREMYTVPNVLLYFGPRDSK